MNDNNLKSSLLPSDFQNPCISSHLDMNKLMQDLAQWNPFAHSQFRGHTGAVWCCAITSNNSHVFSGSEDKTVKIWEACSQRLIGELTCYADTVNGLEVTKDDEYLISGDWSGNLFVHDWRQMALVTKLIGHTSGIYCLALSNDGNYLVSGSQSDSAMVWGLQDFKLKATLQCGGSSVFGLAITSDRKEAFCGGWGGVVRVFNFEDYSLITSFKTHAGIIQCLTVTRDDKYIVLGTRNHSVKVYHRIDRTEYCSFNSHQNWVRNVVCTIDSNYFITVSADKTIRIFHIPSKSEEIQLEGSEGYIFGQCISKDGQYLLTGASDKVMRLWAVGKYVRTKRLRGHSSCIMSVAVTKDDKFVVTGSEDKSVRIWDAIQGIQIAEMRGHAETVWAVAVTSSMKFVISASGDAKVILWNFRNHSIESTLEGHKNAALCATVTSDDKFIITGSQDKTLIVWNVLSKSLVKVLEGHTDSVFTVKATSDNQYIISGAADYTIRIWNLASLTLSEKIETRAGMIDSLAISHDGNYLVFGDRSNSVHLWDMHTKKPIKRFQNHTEWVKSINFSPDGNIFASSSNDSTVRLWNANERRHEQILVGHKAAVRSVAFMSSMGCVVTAGEDSDVIIWDLEHVENLELADIGNSLDSFLYAAKIKIKAHPSEKTCKSVFSRLKVNLAHIYCFLGQEELLYETLMLGTEIRTDADGFSPLYYALRRRSQSCVDLLLKFMCELKETDLENFFDYAYALRDDFTSLLDNISVYLPEFLGALFYTMTDMIAFAAPVAGLPLLKFSDCKTIDFSLFVNTSDIRTNQPELSIEFKTLPFKIDYESGSTGSLRTLTRITRCQNPQVLSTEFVKLFVRYKWNNLWPFILFTTTLLWMNAALMVAILLLSTYNGSYLHPLSGKYVPLVIAFVIINGLLTIYELVQALTVGINYFFSFWNLVDLARFSLSYLWTFLILTQAQTSALLYNITWVFVLLNLFRCLSGFKAFDSTRFYTRLIFKAFSGSFAFVIVFFYSTAAFGVLNYASMDYANLPEGFPLLNIWRLPFELNMGGFDTNIDSLQYVYFLLASVVNVIVLLNLLISILGESFNECQSEAAELDCLEMIETVLEIETLMFWKRKKGVEKYLQVCLAKDVSRGTDLEGKIKAVYAAVLKSRAENEEFSKTITSKLDYIIAKLGQTSST